MEHRAGGELDYRYGDPLPPEWAPLAAPLETIPPLATGLEREFEGLARQLEAAGLAAGASRVEPTFRHCQRTLLAGAREAPGMDSRTTLQLEVRLYAGAGPTAQLALLERAWVSEAALHQQWPALLEQVAARAVDAQRKLEAVEAPEEELTILIPPGSDAGVLFHELCGHPLEGDVVCRRSSYLARRLGQQVAPDFVQVVDDPTGASDTVGYGLDDEGTAPQAVTLLRAGKVDAPLLDLQSARTLGLPPNGHGRRSTFKRFALPRMSHTQLAPHRGTVGEILAETERGLWLTHLTPRRVDLLSGAFSFLIAEARLIQDGRLGPFLRPAVLEGLGLEALARIDRVGGDLQTFYGMKGCGKLDQGGLPVSFGQPSVRISRLAVRPGR